MLDVLVTNCYHYLMFDNTECESCGWVTCPGTCESPTLETATAAACEQCPACDGEGVVLVGGDVHSRSLDDGVYETACTECGA